MDNIAFIINLKNVVLITAAGFDIVSSLMEATQVYDVTKDDCPSRHVKISN